MSYKLITTIVPKNSGELITSAANNAGATGGTILMGQGTAASGILQLLGLGDSSKEITFNIVPDEVYPQAKEEIIKSTSSKKAHFGVFFALEVGNFIKAGNTASDLKTKGTESIKESIETTGEKNMNPQTNYELINVIVNKGYAEDAMAAARKAGAGGGTIINARGTAKESDAKFFGMKIVPEKEMLMILVPADKKEEIVKAINSLPCFNESGSGIIFCQEAKDFTLLGK
ncbi:MAG: transcriptional regulator [Treponema sp.]|nr:transcriptional regulator [Treponema sp.]